jgi:hypothetical protein
MVTPTASDVRLWSRVDFTDLGYPPADPDPLQVMVDRAVAYCQSVTGVMFDASFPDSTTNTPNAQAAVQYATEMLVYEAQEDYLETAADDVVMSFSAGNYSETRVDPEKRAKMRMMNANPALNRALWGLMTPDKQDEWLAAMTGKNAPAMATTEVDWGGWYGPYEPVPGAWGQGGEPGWGDLESG